MLISGLICDIFQTVSKLFFALIIFFLSSQIFQASEEKWLKLKKNFFCRSDCYSVFFLNMWPPRSRMISLFQTVTDSSTRFTYVITALSGKRVDLETVFGSGVCLIETA